MMIGSTENANKCSLKPSPNTNSAPRSENSTIRSATHAQIKDPHARRRAQDDKSDHELQQNPSDDQSLVDPAPL